MSNMENFGLVLWYDEFILPILGLCLQKEPNFYLYSKSTKNEKKKVKHTVVWKKLNLRHSYVK